MQIRQTLFSSFQRLFESREQRIERLFKEGRFIQLNRMGVEPELIEWHAFRSRQVSNADSLMDPLLKKAPANLTRSAEPARLAS